MDIDIERDPRFLELVRLYKYEIWSQEAMYMSMNSILFSAFFAPFSTIAISMQLSVRANAQLLKWKPSPQDDSVIRKLEMEKVELRRLAKQKQKKKTSEMKQIQHQEKSLTPHTKQSQLVTESEVNKAIEKSKHRFFDSKIIESLRDYRRQYRQEQLHRASGQVGENQPYRAPIYRTYRECIRGLYQQGFLGFYKGNFIRQFRLFFVFILYTDMRRLLERVFGTHARTHHHKSVAFSTLVLSILSYPLYTLESRFVLQNRLPGFYTYRSMLGAFHNMMKGSEITQGIIATVPLALCFSLINQQGERPSYFDPLKAGFLMNLALYPLMTVQRRIQCQSRETFMLPERYRNFSHAFRDMYKVEGIRSFYRGFPLHMIGFVGFLMAMQTAKRSMEGTVKSGNVSKEVFQIYKNSK